MHARFLLPVLVFALLAFPESASAVTRWRSEFKTPLDHSIYQSRSIERRGLRSERLVEVAPSGPIKNFNKRGFGLRRYRDKVSRRGGGRSAINVLQRGNYSKSYGRSPLPHYGN